MVESQPSKLLVAGPIPVSRSKYLYPEVAEEGLRLGTTYQQAVLTVEDPFTFTTVRSAVERAFSTAGVAEFLRAIDRANLRIREFEPVLARGLLGREIADLYARLGNADQGQIRELYLASLERVNLDLRDRFFKLYAYY